MTTINRMKMATTALVNTAHATLPAGIALDDVLFGPNGERYRMCEWLTSDDVTPTKGKVLGRAASDVTKVVADQSDALATMVVGIACATATTTAKYVFAMSGGNVGESLITGITNVVTDGSVDAGELLTWHSTDVIAGVALGSAAATTFYFGKSRATDSSTDLAVGAVDIFAL